MLEFDQITKNKNSYNITFRCKPDAYPGPLLMNNNSTHGLLPCYAAYREGQVLANEDELDDKPPQAREEPTVSEIDRMDAVDWDIVRSSNVGADSETSSNESTEWKATYTTTLDVESDNQIYLTTAVDWELHRKRNVTSPMIDITNRLPSPVATNQNQPTCSRITSSPPDSQMPKTANPSISSSKSPDHVSDENYPEAID